MDELSDVYNQAYRKASHITNVPAALEAIALRAVGDYCVRHDPVRINLARVIRLYLKTI